MPDFVADLPADQVHSRLASALRALHEAGQNALLWFTEVLRRKLFVELGYSSIRQYAQEALGFSPARTWQFLRLSERLETLEGETAPMKGGGGVDAPSAEAPGVDAADGGATDARKREDLVLAGLATLGAAPVDPSESVGNQNDTRVHERSPFQVHVML